ncbi:MAG: GMC family oxidoreductase [Deltaproteobacteria bacterium]|nr:GMC family oxidoreductase [Deltaproteobacteria bacterium]
MADFQAVVVGAGAGGPVVAYVLASRGWKVALLEKGRNPYPTLGTSRLRASLFGNDEVRGRRYYAYQDPLIEPRTFRANDAETVRPMGDMQGLGVCVGGGTVQYDGDSPRVQQADLDFLSRFGAVDGAQVVDWPLTYEDLAPYFDEAEKLIGIQGLAGTNPFEEARGPYPMPPGYEPKGATVLIRGAERLGYHPHPMPMAVNSIFYRGRPACVNCGFCAFGCPVNAKGSTAVTAVHDALRTGNLTLLAECCALRIETDGSGRRATGVRYVDSAGVEQVVTADHVILAGNAIETPRLLLLSAGPSHPDGLGNSSGLVGRYLMFHIVFSAVGVFDEEIRTYRGRVVTHALADFTQPDGTLDWIRGGYAELGGSIHPVEEGIRYPWPMHKMLMTQGTFLRRISNVTMIGEDVPVGNNRVDLDPAVRDVYGQPVARVTYARHPRDQAVVDRYMPKLEEIARESGASSVLRFDFHVEEGIPDTKHILGSTRMGTDPAASVTDPWGRLHDVENVWIADGGLFPTSTAFNPTLTQQALAWRTAAYIADPGRPRP